MAKVKQIAMNEVKEEKVDLDNIKNELKIYIDEEIKKEYQEEINKINNKLIREKNKKIIFRNMIILLLIAIIGFLLYLLYDNNYFSKILIKDNDIKEENNNSKKTDENTDNKKNTEDNKNNEEKQEIKPTLDELKDKYGKLIDNYYISDLSIYKDDYYNGNLTNEIKSYMTLNNIDFKNLEIDDNSNIISEAEFSEIYESLFDDKYVGINFDYNGNKIRYLSKISSYITEKELVKENHIVREISDIQIDDRKVLITCIEGKVINNNLYNILTDNEIDLYNGNLLKYQDKLNKIIYIFENNKLINISK